MRAHKQVRNGQKNVSEVCFNAWLLEHFTHHWPAFGWKVAPTVATYKTRRYVAFRYEQKARASMKTAQVDQAGMYTA